jgi:hypothetical protein
MRIARFATFALVGLMLRRENDRASIGNSLTLGLGAGAEAGRGCDRFAERAARHHRVRAGGRQVRG